MENSDIKLEKTKLILDFYHRTFIHYTLWYAEVKHQLGEKKALEYLNEAYDKLNNIHLKRLSEVFGFELKNGVPSNFLNASEEKLDEMLKATAVNWLATDGVWFQTVEFNEDMFEAKRCNDSCWAWFSPVEASRIKKILNLGDNSGLEGLKKALSYRMYSFINKQSIVDETENSFVFQMNECRVQNARQRKGLDDYPCKSGGMVEFSRFASEIDSRIKTECIGCPPDEHPQEWFCSWKFTI